ncbi:MAG: F0F1 ATP synthase subunit A [Alphaproteobacteria bacterium]|nr:F0F1 ATP synthase subunit A [Alphaproteobacteria bacterium]MBQ9235686.1 F0F1 ATP synthase subunit A [Alphaproteobacteria bacterium]
MSNPMEQFEIKPIIPLELGGVDISFTNSALFMVIAVMACTLVFSLCLRKRTLVPNAAQSLVEGMYEFVHNLLRENVGNEGLKYFPFIFTVFSFVAFGNVLGLFPYAFTFTSHLTAVGCLSIIALLFNIGIGMKKKKIGWLRTFLPKGIPLALAPLIVPIEMISFLSKPFSLTVRLVANMTVGHIMLKIIAGFIVGLGVLGAVPLLFDSAIICFEIFISLLQAFIYTVLSCIYLGDAIHEH